MNTYKLVRFLKKWTEDWIANPRDIKPGLYSGVPEVVYHALLRVSNSYLNHFGKTAAHAEVAIAENKAKGRTDAMRESGALHVAVLEPKRFASDIHFLDEDQPGFVSESSGRLLKAGLVAFDELKLKHGVDHVFRAKKKAMMEGVLKAMTASPFLAARWKSDLEGHREVTAIFDYEVDIGGKIELLPCKLRVDSLARMHSIDWLRDYKFVVDASGGIGPNQFGRMVGQRGYDRQLVFYGSALTALGYDCPRRELVAIEKQAPYEAEAYELDADTMDDAAHELKRRLVMAALGFLRGYWPGYTTARVKAGDIAPRTISKAIWHFQGTQ